MSFEKCENEPACQSTFSKVYKSGTVSVHCYDVRHLFPPAWNFFLSSNSLNPRKPNFLIASNQVSSFSFIPAVAWREIRLLVKIRNYRYILLSTKRQKSIPRTVESLRNFIRIVRFPVYGVMEKSLSSNDTSRLTFLWITLPFLPKISLFCQRSIITIKLVIVF